MLKQYFVIEAKETDPYVNLAREEYLLFHMPKHTAALYLWQNDKTIVIGQNQNPVTQCRIDCVREQEIKVARRLSGGGAVYHDLGNLNYTFLSRSEEFSVEKNIEILLTVLHKYAIPAKKIGRNDIEVDGKKVSGNAFYQKETYAYHHGTLLVDSDLHTMQRLLNVDRKKWSDRGIDSVRSRVENLTKWNTRITVDELKVAIANAFADTNAFAYKVDEIVVPPDKLKVLKEKYNSHEWIWGKTIPGTFCTQERFSWGEVQVVMDIEGEYIRDIALYSDSLEVDSFPVIEGMIKGTRLDVRNIRDSIERINEPVAYCIAKDITSLITESI